MSINKNFPEINNNNNKIDLSNHNLSETSKELINLFLNYPEIIELDLSNNNLTKLPLEISFLTVLTKLDIRNNKFTDFNELINVLVTIKSLTNLSIDLIDSTEAMLILNKLPNIEILNDHSTKEEDDEEEENEDNYYDNEDEDFAENYNSSNSCDNMNNKIKNTINNHLKTNMEKIEEAKNLESNSNLEDSKLGLNNINSDKKSLNKNNRNNSNNNLDSNNNLLSSEDIKIKNKTWTRNNNVLKDKDLNPKSNTNSSNNTNNNNSNNNLILSSFLKTNEKNKLNNSNNNINNINNNSNNYNNDNNINNNNNNNDNNDNNNDNNNNNNNNNFIIDLNIDELNNLFNLNSEQNLIKNLNQNFYNYINNYNKDNNKNINNINYINNFSNEINTIEENKSNYSKFFYLTLIQNSKMKFIKNLVEKILPILIEKNPDLNNNNFFINILNEIFNSFNIITSIISNLNTKIDNYYLIEEQKIKNLEKNKEILIKSLNDNKDFYEKKINNLENENKKMTEKILQKANNIFLNTNSNNNNDNQNFNNFNNNKKMIYTSPEDSMKKLNNNTINTSSIKYKKNKKLVNNHNNSCSSISYNNIYLNTLNNSTINNFNFGNLTGRISSPSKSNIINKFKTLSSYRSSSISNYHHNNISKINNSMDNNDNTIKINKIYNKNISIPTITLKTLKELISEIYQSKTLYDKKCIENHLPRETMEQHMYTYLNKKYGLKKLVIDWARNIINGIKIYSKLDSIVFLFGKIMRNEQEENARFILEKIVESIDELLLFYIKQKKPLKNKNEILKLFEEKKNSLLNEEEWKGIIFYLYENNEANEIQKKIEMFIKINYEKEKEEILNSDRRLKNINNNDNNNIKINESRNFKTISSNSYYLKKDKYNNLNKLSREEKFKLINQKITNKKIFYKDFIKIILDCQIKFRDKQLKNFLFLFRKVDLDKDGIINENEFIQLIKSFDIFNVNDIEKICYKFLEEIDPFENNFVTFSDCINFFSSELYNYYEGVDTNSNNEKRNISILEKICLGKNFKNGNLISENNSNNSNNNY